MQGPINKIIHSYNSPLTMFFWKQSLNLEAIKISKIANEWAHNQTHDDHFKRHQPIGKCFLKIWISYWKTGLTSLGISPLFSSVFGSWSLLFIRFNFLSLIAYPGTVSFFKALFGIPFGVPLCLSDGWTGDASGGGVSVLLRFVRFGVLQKESN